MKQTLLIVPPTGKYIREDRCQTPIEELKTVALRPPIDLLYAAAAFESSGCSCRMIDFPAEGKTWNDLEKIIREFKPDLLILSITTPSLEKDLKAASLAKKIDPSIITVAKGAHFNILDVDSLEKYPDLDIVLRGEYEPACMELGQGNLLSEIEGITFRNSEGKVVRNPARPFILDLDALPFPARHLAKNELYVRPDTGEPQTTIVTNRGCPFSCIFCLANQVAGRKNRVRSQENIIREIKECINRYGIRNFLFRSDLFTANKEWVMDLCSKIKEEGLDITWACNSRVDTANEKMLRAMREAGCWLIAYGVESGSQEILDKMNKRIKLEDAEKALNLTRKVGLKSSIYFLFGLPWDSPEVFKDDLKFAKKLNPDFLEIFYVYPFPGTELYRIAIEEGLLKKGEIPKSAYDHPAMPTKQMSIEELAQWRRKFLKRFYLRPSYILKTLSGIRSPKMLFNYIRVGFAQLKDFFS